MILTLAKNRTAPPDWPYKTCEIIDKYIYRVIKTESEFLPYWRCVCLCDGKTSLVDYELLIELIRKGVYEVSK